MNVQTVTNRYLRTLARMKGKLEADLSTVTKTLEAFGGEQAIQTRRMSPEHRVKISRAMRSRRKTK